MEIYGGDEIWQKDDNYTNNFDIEYITYIHKEQQMKYMNATIAGNRFLKESEYLSMRFNPALTSASSRI